MDQKNKAEAAGHGCEPKKRDITSWCLIIAVIAVAVVAIGFYVVWLGKIKPSTDPGDWADFATYLSGTVGVTAVVATLFVLVRTLKQQQALIDSQNIMLQKQQELLNLTHTQVNSEEKRRAVELVYNSAANIFPDMVNDLEKKMNMSVFEFFKMMGWSIFLPKANFIDISVGSLFESENDLNFVLRKIDNKCKQLICFGLTQGACSVGVFMSGCLKEAPELDGYFRAKLGDKNFQVIRCAMLYRKNDVGLEFEKHQARLRISTSSTESYIERCWQAEGEEFYRAH